MPKHIEISGSSKTTTVIGLSPGAQYNVSIAAASDAGRGPLASRLFWTEVGVPDVPETPKLVAHDNHNGVVNGEIHVKISPLTRFRNGPITSYRIVVIDETDPVPFHPENLGDWSTADKLGLKYYIAAEIPPSYFDRKKEFVVGDLQYYGDFFNYGPLTEDRDYHVTIGAVSTLNNVTKVSYAKVSHEQHAKENLVVFEFHDHDHDHHRGNDDHDDHDDDHEASSADPLAVGLSVAVVIALFALIGVLAVLWFVRRRVHAGKTSSRSDVQELTTHQQQVDAESGSGSVSSVGDRVDGATEQQLEVVKNQIWTIPRNFVNLSQDVVGRGKFGTILKATVNKRGAISRANVQVVPGKVLIANEVKDLTKDLDVAVRCGNHCNLIQLVGICEDKDTLFVSYEDTDDCLKQVLLDSRALIHHPVFAEKNRSISTANESSIFDYLIGIARGMNHLYQLRVRRFFSSVKTTLTVPLLNR